MLMTVGQFAQASGLPVTALRFYDEKGLLTPRDVDPHNGYRRYGGGQLRRAAMIKVLRDMGMSLAQVRAALDEPDRAAGLVRRFLDDLAEARARQDAAVQSGLQVLRSYEEPVPVPVRRRPAQPWIGALFWVDLSDIDSERDAERYNAAFAGLAGALQQAGTPPTGPFWTTIRAAGSPTAGEVVLSWPVAAPVPASFTAADLRLERGTLPARSEAYVELRFDAEDYPQAEGTGAPHPAMLALLEYAEEHGGEEEEFRQVGIPGEDGTPVGIELTVTVAVPEDRPVSPAGPATG